MMEGKALAFTLAFLLSSITYCHACSCMRQHPQEHYCNSDFVILARVKKEQIVESTHSKVYKVRVRKEFKISEKGIVALKSGRLITPIYDAMCGVNLQVGKLYVISGRINSLRAHVNLCNMIVEWNELTRRQRKGLKLLYKHGCSCKIKNCMYFSRCSRQKDSCNWKSPCETTEGVCIRQANGSCMWNKNKMLSTCKINQHRKNSTQETYVRKHPKLQIDMP